MTTALDLFAGVGWSLACQRLGITTYGVENKPNVLATREAAGMQTPFTDVLEGIRDQSIVPEFDLLIASPPCQTFSVASGGPGRKHFDTLGEIIATRDYVFGQRLIELSTEVDDPRTGLVLTPLYYAFHRRPRAIVLEQVNTVLPLWKVVLRELRSLGYQGWTGSMQAETVGVPQTRTRAVLVATLDGAPEKIVATHSRYLPRSPTTLELGVEKWVSMRDALGREEGLLSQYSNNSVYGDRHTRGPDHPSFTITSKANRNFWVPWGFTDRPAVTVGNAVGRGLIGGQGGKDAVLREMEAGRFVDSPHGDGSSYAERTRITPAEAGVLQSFPADFPWQGTKTEQFLTIGNAVPPLMAEAILRTIL